MMTNRQLQLIHQAKRSLNLEDCDYRTVLRSVAGVASSKQLDQRGFELIMAYFESRGFAQPGAEPGYWQSKAERYSRGQITDRQIRAIESLVSQTSYRLGGFLSRMTRNRTDDLRKLTAREAYNVIEALKKMADRPQGGTDARGTQAEAHLPGLLAGPGATVPAAALGSRRPIAVRRLAPPPARELIEGVDYCSQEQIPF